MKMIIFTTVLVTLGLFIYLGYVLLKEEDR
ncbi:potassium-transporting ATPase subunit F [Liquorilactobacillus satsumensis]|nr:potassium-transporting ATPase subunit F [Liquorilactobacillus satsumensis]MCP9312765.1 potassium-transporting ATPase subunit F [Liquorilactobacillus satsumensis]MCP9327969.1 potassium-transporting ATPase subunit F [Liquorilactobacillus satsumensis]MCP9358413.1 potassium-transporting ATPase subunit F [Liquorilactobacillus satsumensis]MCP9359221.1 potassium-transporting ATPase subunit F [Liquorilactobacillus satsumensis]